MIQNKSFPTDPRRRWVIAKLLQIPPLLLGVNALDDLLPDLRTETIPEEPKGTVPFDTGIKSVDLKEYRQALRTYWNLNLTNTASVVWQEMQQRIYSLEQGFLYRSSEKKQKLQFVLLLCEYHMVLGNIARDQEWYDLAIQHFNRAYVLAKSENLPVVQAAVLAGRGSVFLEQASIYRDMFDPDFTSQYISLAVDDFRMAREIGDRDPGSGEKGYIQLSFAVALAHAATNPQELHQALGEIDRAEHFIGKELPKVDGGGIFVMLDEERYHLDRASAYIGASVSMAQYPRDARRELRSASAAQISSKTKRRQTYNTVLLAKSYLVEGEYSEATEQAKEAFVQAKAIHSNVNLARIAAICRELRVNGYSQKHIEIPALEIEVAKAKHPELFG